MPRLAKNIPLLAGKLYHEHYFKHLPDGTTVAGAPEYFEIYNRCLWKPHIAPHRLDFYMVFLVTAGAGVQTLGNRTYHVHKNMLCFVGPNMINAWQSENEENRGYFCTFSDDFYNAGRLTKGVLSDLPFFQIDGDAVLYLSDEQTERYALIFQMMEQEYKSRNVFSKDVLRGLLYALISKAHGDYAAGETNVPRSSPAGLRLVKAFTSLYMDDVNTVRKGKDVKLKRVADYAEQLGVSQNHLNDTIKEVTGQSAGRLMRNQLVKQATMCLRHSSKSISEIAYLLGFEDASYFSRFYKKQTGKLPSDFRPHPPK